MCFVGFNISLNAAQIKAKALALGFHLVGIAPAGRLPEAEFYRSWLANGYAGEMGYLSRNVEKRENGQALFPPTRAIIVCGLSYHSTPATLIDGDNSSKGRISRYAWGDDYHTVIKAKLVQLLAWLQETASMPVEAQICVDTAPILERIYGKAAGLGWLGKNSCLINQRYGSWFCLGEILLNLDLETDTPAPECCGTCTRCLDACPTHALIAPHVLDARRCLSYLTIELKEMIPEEFRRPLSNRIFGCDCCQEVCPWNQKAVIPASFAFAPRPQLLQPYLAWLLTLSAETFSAVFRNNPVKRAKLRGLLRNTALAVGNSGNSAFIPLLVNLYQQADPLVQPHLAWALQQLLLH
jgi:epoxyqueuosine reductase